MTDKPKRTAVLIDADNASYRHAEALFAEIAKLGEAVVRRIYGDFSTTNLRGWSDKMAPYALMPVQTVAYTKGKNASDIALVIDAMELLHTGNYDAFCIISSDSDFTRLAQKLREGGAEVYGFGEMKTPEAFRQSCRRFFFVENLGTDETAAVATEPTLPGLPKPSLPATQAITVIRRAYDRHVGDNAEGWVNVRKLRQTISNIAADFDERTYGEQRLGDLAKKTGVFDLKNVPGQGWWVRYRTSNTRRRRSSATATVVHARHLRAPHSGTQHASTPQTGKKRSK